MSASLTVERVRSELLHVFSLLDAWFELPDELLRRRPDCPDAWSPLEHLEHVCLANRFLLLTISKGCRIAMKRAAGAEIPAGESDLEPLAPIALPGAFVWDPPLHMLPTGKRDPAELKGELAGERDQALALLAAMPAGEGKLYRIGMSVHRLGRLDMYQWLYFLARHARYHLVLLERVAGFPHPLESACRRVAELPVGKSGEGGIS